MTWIWLSKRALLSAHDEQLAEHGGATGIRDEGLLDSALARPLNLVAYGEPDALELAAAYGFGLAKNHPFTDGNKRVAAIATESFLMLNGFELTVSDEDFVMMFLRLAAGEIGEIDLADWLRANVRSP